MKPSLISSELRAEIDAYLFEALSRGGAAESVRDEIETALRTGTEPSFRDRLRIFMDRDGRTDPEIYKAAGVSSSDFSRMRSGDLNCVKKLKVISFAFVMRLSCAETEQLLHSAGLALSGSEKFDLIVRFFLERGRYDVTRVNDALLAYEQPMICGAL